MDFEVKHAVQGSGYVAGVLTNAGPGAGLFVLEVVEHVVTTVSHLEERQT